MRISTKGTCSENNQNLLVKLSIKMTRKTVVYVLMILFLTGSILFSTNLDIDIKPTGGQYLQITKTIANNTKWGKTKKETQNHLSVSVQGTKDTSYVAQKSSLNTRSLVRRVSVATSTVNEKQNISKKDTVIKQVKSGTYQSTKPRKGRTFLVHWNNPPKFLKFRKPAYSATFSGCEYSNCEITYDKNQARLSDAVIFDGRWVPEKLAFKRPLGQPWIFAAHESPETYNDLGDWWTKPQWVSSFNWTMTYNKDSSDIYLPYGEIRPTTDSVDRNFTEIALQKKKTALAIISHCTTHSLREMYIRKLKRYIDIDVLGHCGKPWPCGKRYLHDGCFQILNTTYKFFLSFENALCNHYFTEKLFENYNYDIVLIVHGGQKGDINQHLVEGTYLSTDDFDSVHDLGRHLQFLSWSLGDYAKVLRKKSDYKSEKFEVVYKRALCDVCKRVNNQGEYRQSIKNIKQLIYKNSKCRAPQK